MPEREVVAAHPSSRPRRRRTRSRRSSQQGADFATLASEHVHRRRLGPARRPALRARTAQEYTQLEQPIPAMRPSPSRRSVDPGPVQTPSGCHGHQGRRRGPSRTSARWSSSSTPRSGRRPLAGFAEPRAGSEGQGLGRPALRPVQRTGETVIVAARRRRRSRSEPRSHHRRRCSSGTPESVNPGRVVAVGLGPAGVDLMLPSARSTMSYMAHRYARTARHPAIDELAPHGLEFAAFDDRYDAADDFDDLYRGDRRRRSSPPRAEHGDDLLRGAGQPGRGRADGHAARGPRPTAGEVELEIMPGLSFADLAWSRLGVDPMDGARLVDGQRVRGRRRRAARPAAHRALHQPDGPLRHQARAARDAAARRAGHRAGHGSGCRTSTSSRCRSRTLDRDGRAGPPDVGLRRRRAGRGRR